jgi:hypothetical protein
MVHASPAHPVPQATGIARSYRDSKETYLMARIMSCFPWDESRQTLEVALSERDLITLLGLLYTRGGPKAIVTRDVPIEFAHCRIAVQWDEQHYAHPSRDGAPPATVNPMESVIERTMDQLLQRQLQHLGTERRVDWVEGADR